MPAKVLAYGMGADYLEQDIVASRDGALLVLHDLYLELVSDVIEQFPGRSRPDGHYYCIDFDLEEIRGLRFGERLDPATGKLVFPGRFPRQAGSFTVNTLDDEIDLVEALNVATGRSVGIYPEIKDPAWHRDNGIDLGDRLLTVLEARGYLNQNKKYFIQCFDSNELKIVREKAGKEAQLIQLLSSKDLRRDDATAHLNEIRSYATGIGPSLSLIYRGRSPDGVLTTSSLVSDAQATGLLVHPYTLRADALPAGIPDLESLLELLIDGLGVDGVFTDFPDRVSAYCRNR
jgi:glycerophosphoryl diester phosphodiesterase